MTFLKKLEDNSSQKTISICGTRGVPARYGGFETFAEELGKRLVERNYQVIVYCRYYKGEIPVRDNYLGMTRVPIRAFRHKYFETPIHSLFCFIDLIKRRPNVVLLCNAANSPFAWIVRLIRLPLAINVDGIERGRRKWNILGKAWYMLGECCSCLFASIVISDADYIKNYYLSNYATTSELIRYGSKQIDSTKAKLKYENDFSWLSDSQNEILNNFNLKPGSYFLYVSRLEPENNADKVIRSYNLLPEDIKLKFPLVVVGDAPYASKFISGLKEIADQHVIFLGYQFGEFYECLQSSCYLYIQATEVGGTHPALVEAMGFANCIIANDVKEHREVCLNTSIYYPYNEVLYLSQELQNCVNDLDLVLAKRRESWKRAVSTFDWEVITSQYEKLFLSII